MTQAACELTFREKEDDALALVLNECTKKLDRKRFSVCVKEEAGRGLTIRRSSDNDCSVTLSLKLAYITATTLTVIQNAFVSLLPMSEQLKYSKQGLSNIARFLVESAADCDLLFPCSGNMKCQYLEGRQSGQTRL